MPDESDSNFYLTDASPKDKPWDSHRALADRVEGLYDLGGFQRYAKRVHECSQRLGFILEAQDTGEFLLRLRTARFCRVRLCPVCQWRRSLMWRARFIKAIPKLYADFPKARYIFLTLTVKNCEVMELRSTLNTMTAAWNRFTKRKQFPAIGYVRATEVTRNPQTGQAHPHFHVLMMVKSTYFKTDCYLSQQRWRELWQSCLKVDYLPVVNVKTVKQRLSKVKTLNEGDPIDITDPMIAGILETVKYSVKPDDLVADQDWLIELTRQLHRTRGLMLGGVFKNYLSENEPDDLISEDEEKFSDSDLLMVFDWGHQSKRYKKTGVMEARFLPRQ